MSKNCIDRFTTWGRILHWTVAISFFILLLSGIGLFAHVFFGFFHIFGGPEQSILVHKWTGVVFFVCSILLFLSHIGETFRFDADDARWIAKLGGYLSCKHADIPQGKFNAGQKLFGIFAFIATVVMGVTGWIIWHMTSYSLEMTQLSLMLHSLFFALFMIGMVIHIYLATIGNPGTLAGMLWGKVTKNWAKTHASKWYQKVVKN